MAQDELDKKQLISIICPVFNEEKSIPLFYNRIQPIIESLKGSYNFELIFTNNRSTDRTLEIIVELRKKDSNIQLLTMSRNFGYQASVQAGMSFAGGDVIIVIDVDCEDPPELIPQFITKWEEGYDVVYGIRKDRHENRIIKTFRNLFYHLLQKTADMDIVLYMAEFALISSVVRDSIVNNENTFPFLRAEIGYAGFRRFGIPYKRDPRIAGETNYNFFGMITFGMAGILTSSTFLNRLAVYILPFIILLNILLFVGSVCFDLGEAFKILVCIDFMYLITLLTTHGAYISRIYKNGIGRPIFIVDPKKSYYNNNFSKRNN